MKKAVILLVLFCSACGSLIIGSKGWYDANRANSKSSLEKQAAFDLSCDVAELQFTPLGEGSATHQTMGVSGCGKKVKYIWIQEKLQWVANTVQN